MIEEQEKDVEKTYEGEKKKIEKENDYSGRSELLHAIECLVQDSVDVTQEHLEQRLFTSGMPDPDLLIRTAGEMRISNFLLWQIAYSEIYVTDQCWPDFDGDSLDAAIAEFINRKRTFGKINK